MDLPVVNHKDYFAKIGDDHKFPINKFGDLADYLIKEKIVKKVLKTKCFYKSTILIDHSTISFDQVSKLNQIIKNFSIEIKRTNKNAIFVGLQPGTVKSFLSKPFERNVKEDNLFTPEYSAEKLLQVINDLSPDDSGKFFAWNGEEIQP